MIEESAEIFQPEWWRDIYDAFKRWEVIQVAYVPDAGHRELITACLEDQSMTAIALTTEEEGIALLSGAWLGHARGALLMQSSGVGNCVNMMSLLATCQFPLAMFVTMRGQHQEFNPWQLPMGRTVEPVLKGAGFEVTTAHQPRDVGPMSEAVLAGAFMHEQTQALLLHQSLMPVKTFGK